MAPTNSKKSRDADGRDAAPLSAVFDGHCTLDIADLEAPPLGDRYPLRSDIVFSPARDAVTLRELDEITTPRYEADLGPARVKNSTTVRLASAEPGKLTRDGHFSIPVVLRFDHSVDVPLYEEDSDLPVTLSTRGAGGAPLDAKGKVVLVGQGTFKGGALHGKRCTLTYAGRVSPLPW
jgi:hypothetical protein